MAVIIALVDTAMVVMWPLFPLLNPRPPWTSTWFRLLALAFALIYLIFNIPRHYPAAGLHAAILPVQIVGFIYALTVTLRPGWLSRKPR